MCRRRKNICSWLKLWPKECCTLWLCQHARPPVIPRNYCSTSSSSAFLGPCPLKTSFVQSPGASSMIGALRRVEMKRRSKLRKGLRIKDRKVLLIFFIQILGKNFLQFTLIIAFTSTTNMNIDGIKIDIICGFLRPLSIGVRCCFCCCWWWLWGTLEHGRQKDRISCRSFGRWVGLSSSLGNNHNRTPSCNRNTHKWRNIKRIMQDDK